MRLSELQHHDDVAELVRRLAHDEIDIEEFWQEMRRHLTDEEIVRFCSGGLVE